MSIQVFKGNERYHTNHGWLDSYFSFSFADYYDPSNLQFSALRVLNDDVVAPRKGFPMHPHREMEIVSIVLSGYLRHEDSMGHRAVTTFGGIQRMSAGTGIYHSEYNDSTTEDVNLLQLWFLPERQGIEPSYEQTVFNIEHMKNNLLPVVTQNPTTDNVAHINQDVTIFLSQLEVGHEVELKTKKERNVFLFVIEGEVIVNNGEKLQTRDSARISNEENVRIEATEEAKFMLIDLL